MDLSDHQNNKPISHYESVVLTKDTNTLIQLTKRQAFDFMDQLEGWCSKSKASILMDLVFMLKPQIAVEIGVFGGKSLVPMAFALKVADGGTIYGIDPWDSHESIDGMDGVNYDWWGSIDHEKILKGLQMKIAEFEINDHVLLIKSTSEQAPLIYNIDLLHIDGNHSEKSSFIDVTKWVPLVRRGGVIILDDITWGTMGKAVKWLDENCIKLAEFHESNDWGIWIKQ